MIAIWIKLIWKKFKDLLTNMKRLILNNKVWCIIWKISMSIEKMKWLLKRLCWLERFWIKYLMKMIKSINNYMINNNNIWMDRLGNKNFNKFDFTSQYGLCWIRTPGILGQLSTMMPSKHDGCHRSAGVGFPTSVTRPLSKHHR